MRAPRLIVFQKRKQLNYRSGRQIVVDWNGFTSNPFQMDCEFDKTMTKSCELAAIQSCSELLRNKFLTRTATTKKLQTSNTAHFQSQKHCQTLFHDKDRHLHNRLKTQNRLTELNRRILHGQNVEMGVIIVFLWKNL